MITTLISLIVLAVILGLIYWALTLLPLPHPFPTIIKVCMILIVVLVLLGVLTGNFNLPQIRGL